jgi:hypothetical protein
MLKTFRIALASIVALTLGACVSQPDAPTVDDSAAEIAGFIAADQLRDDRGRFREIFCAVLETRGEELPDYRSCEEAIRETGPEAGATGAGINLGQSDTRPLVLVVPGLGWECFEKWLEVQATVPAHVIQFGYEMRTIPVDGLSSSGHNAGQINAYINALPPEDLERPLILTGYSKGTPDILEALVRFPQLAQKVTAVLSLAGSVKGSPLADIATQEEANLMTLVPGARCDKGDEGAVNSLRTDVRQTWLAQNPLPTNVQYYSVATYPDYDHVSWAFRKSYLVLSGVDARNDTQLLVYDQIIPRSKLVAFINADHWAIAVPVDRKHKLIGSTFVNHNDYPREALLEALLRYVEEDLAGQP